MVVLCHSSSLSVFKIMNSMTRRRFFLNRWKIVCVIVLLFSDQYDFHCCCRLPCRTAFRKPSGGHLGIILLPILSKSFVLSLHVPSCLCLYFLSVMCKLGCVVTETLSLSFFRIILLPILSKSFAFSLLAFSLHVPCSVSVFFVGDM